MRKISEVYVNGICLEEILEKHKKWLSGKDGGEKANLRFIDLRFVDFEDTDLRFVDLRGADLRFADLRDVDLRGANLRGANLSLLIK